MPKKILFSFLFFWTVLVIGQEMQPVADPMENIHLHLNKTTFLQGEHLWFKAYIRDQRSKLPSTATTNLHVAIYDAAGNLVKRKLLYVENGMAHGDFAIDAALDRTNYTLVAWTNYMGNFKVLEPFRQKITILREDEEAHSRENKRRISVYPEGGQLIAGSYNNVGILADNGLGQGLQLDKLTLMDQNGNIIRSNITTNAFGMGKVRFYATKDNTYFLQCQLPNGEKLQQKLPIAHQDQLGLALDNMAMEKVLISLVGAKETFLANVSAVYTMAFYQDDFFHFEEISLVGKEEVFSIDRKLLPFGIITTVLFDTDARPIAHRVFFNHRKDENSLQHLEVDHCFNAKVDSVQIDFILPKGFEDDVNISLSVLPGQSSAYHPDNSLATSFLLRPYVNNFFQDHYFLEALDRKKRYELDKRLLVEGWGKYDWDSKKQEEVQLAFELETGISFEGKILDANLKKENQVSLVNQRPPELAFKTLDSSKTFQGTMQLFKGDSLLVGLIGKNGKLRKPAAELNFEKKSKPPFVNPTFMNQAVNRPVQEHVEESNVLPVNLDKRTIALEEVVVSERKGKATEAKIYASVEAGIIDDLVIKRYPSLQAYLQRRGFYVDFVDGEWLVREVLSKKPFPVFFDGAPSMNGEFVGTPLNRFKRVYIGFQAIYLLWNYDYVPPNRRNRYIKFAVKNGYIRPQAYFMPNYPSYDSAVFKTYGALDWKANVSVGNELPISIVIPLKNQKRIQLFIEGMGTNGSLVAQRKTIDLN